MNNASLNVLLGLMAWTLFLLILMEILRTQLVFTRTVSPTQFRPDNSNLSPFMQRLARAHANCVENLPVFGIVLIAALISDRAAVTNPLAPWLLAARIVQSGAHLSSASTPAALIRFTAFTVQLAIVVYWLWRLLLG